MHGAASVGAAGHLQQGTGRLHWAQALDKHLLVTQVTRSHSPMKAQPGPPMQILPQRWVAHQGIVSLAAHHALSTRTSNLCSQGAYLGHKRLPGPIPIA